jgi:cytochrome c oxidase assembly factor CtaG
MRWANIIWVLGMVIWKVGRCSGAEFIISLNIPYVDPGMDPIFT